MIKILAACGAGVNSSHQIKSALEEELSTAVLMFTVMQSWSKTLTKILSKVIVHSSHQLLQQILVLTQVFQLSKLDQSYSGIPAMSAPVFDNIEAAIKEHGLS